MTTSSSHKRGRDDVSRVELAIPGISMGGSSMEAQLSAKYGKHDAAWPTLRESTAMGTNSIILEAGTDAKRRLKLAFEAAVLARTPKTGKAVDFH